MASTKAIKFENEMLALVGGVKQLILKNIPEDESDGRQELQGAVNALYERAHFETRQLRKALAFTHDNVRLLEDKLRECGVDLTELYKTYGETESSRTQRQRDPDGRSSASGASRGSRPTV